MAATAPEIVIAQAPPAEPQRPRVLLVGTALGSLAVTMVFGLVLGAYFQVRAGVIADGETWLPDGATIPLTAPNMAMGTLLMSAVTMQWAVYAARNRDRAHMYLAIGTTLLLGVAVVNGLVYLFTQMHLPATATTQGLLITTITGMQIAASAAGLIFIGLMGLRALGGDLTGRDREGIAAAALYWYVTIGIFSILWYGVYITK